MPRLQNAWFWLPILITMLSVVACASPDVETPTSGATVNARATVAADVRRITAGESAPAPTPEPTVVARPRCDNGLWWYEAREHVGERHAVAGLVVHTRALKDGRFLLELGQPYPDPTSFVVVVVAGPPRALEGKTICATGRIDSLDGLPTIDVPDAASVSVLN